MSLQDKRIYFPVESIVGLGHFNRAGAIARGLKAGGADVTVASGTFVDEKRFFSGVRCVSMPPHVFEPQDSLPYFIDTNGQRRLLDAFNAAAHMNARKDIHVKNVEGLKPDIFISEFWPFDRPAYDNEMLEVLGHRQIKDSKTLRIASIRDVLDTKGDVAADSFDVSARGERDAFAVDTINTHYDAVMVHGDPLFMPLSKTFGMTDKIRKDIIYTGFVTANLPGRDAGIDYSSAPLVVSCGSGLDGQELVFSFLTAWQKMLESSPTDSRTAFVCQRPVHIVCGPRFQDRDYQDVMEWVEIIKSAHPCDIQIARYRDDFTQLLAQAAFSISMAGYNTTLETLSIGTPALFVPKFTHYDGKMAFSSEQYFRLANLEEKGIASFAPPDEVLRSDLFAARIIREFEQQFGCRRRASLNFDGVNQTVSILGKLATTKRCTP